jgi:hypothetical protein
MVRRPDTPLLEEKWSTFIQGGVSIVAASGDSGKVPSIVRAVGCRLSADRKKVTVLVSSSQGKELLDAVRSTGAIAVVFAQPSTHITIQLKSSDARVTQARASDADVVERYTRAFCADLILLGYGESFTRALLWCDEAELIAVTFTPDKAFLQTPGPGAGDFLRNQQ